MSYFLIYGSENGNGTRVVQFEHADQLKSIMEDHTIRTFRTELGNYGDTNSWPEHEGLLIKGAVIMPTPKKVVTDWEI